MGKAIAADFGRLLGLAFVLSLALGLLLTAAAVAIPAPLACGWSVRLPIAGGRTSDGVAVPLAQRKVRALVDSAHEGADPDVVTPSRPEEAAPRSHAVPTNLPHGWGFEPQWGALPQTATPAPLHATITLIALVLAALSKAARKPRPSKRTASGLV